MSRAMDINCFQEIMRSKSKYWLKRQSQRGMLKSTKKVSQDKMIIFIDDVNLVVAKDDSSDQPVLECIRQMICEGIFVICMHIRHVASLHNTIHTEMCANYAS